MVANAFNIQGPLTSSGPLTISKGGAGTGGGNGGGNSLQPLLRLLGSVAPSGNTLLDQSGNGHDFTYEGSNPYNNNTYQFSGSNRASCSNFSSTFLTNTVAIFSWVKVSSFNPNNSDSIISRGTSFGFRIDNSGSKINLVKYNVADQRVSISPLSTNTWYHLCAVQSATEVQYLVNGTVVGSFTNSRSFNQSSAPVYIGYDNYTSIKRYSNLMLGRVDMYNTATVSDAQAAWNSQKSAYGY